MRLVPNAELLTVSQAAEALGASTQTIRSWTRAERLHGVRIGNRFLIPRGEVDRLRGGLATSTGESPWDCAEDDAGQSLPRAGDRGAVAESTSDLLGG